MTNGKVASGQPVQQSTSIKATVTIDSYYTELAVSSLGTGGSTEGQYTAARNLSEFVDTSKNSGGYYIGRYEASESSSALMSQYNKAPLVSVTQAEAATKARAMYNEVKSNNNLLYASDLVNSYAWDTAVIFIQTYSNKTDASNYSKSNNSSSTMVNTGKTIDKYCNIWDMSGNAEEWTTAQSSLTDGSAKPCVCRGGNYSSNTTTVTRQSKTNTASETCGFRVLLYVNSSN